MRDRGKKKKKRREKRIKWKISKNEKESRVTGRKIDR